MLKRLEVENFRGFRNRIAFDLTAGRYDFRPEVVTGGLVKNAIVYGPNGIGKSALGLAVFDLIHHLTDKRPFEPKQVIPYVNMGSGHPVANFRYVFAFDIGEVVYEYGKVDPVSLAWERLSVDGECLLEYDFQPGGVRFVKDGLVGPLNVSLPDNRLSIVKYVFRNTPTNTVPAITRLVAFCEHMLWYRSLSDGNQFAGYHSAPMMLCEMLTRSSTPDRLSAFLSEFGQDYRLGIEKINGESVLFSYYANGQKAPFETVASTGTKTLYLFYCWSVTAFSDVSFLFIDEFDAFLHYEASAALVGKLNGSHSFQTVLTTHNTSLLSSDLTRPDCSFLMSKDGDASVQVSCLCDLTDREIRKVHNLEKMYRAGAFS